LKKLLCFGERVWGELRGVVEKEGWGGAVRRPACSKQDHNVRVPEDGENLEEDRRCLEIFQRRFPWWEVEHWGEIFDERRLWGDLSREDQRALNRLLGKG
jgi:hypothetical protein